MTAHASSRANNLPLQLGDEIGDVPASAYLSAAVSVVEASF